jgi:hypothetical protein
VCTQERREDGGGRVEPERSGEGHQREYISRIHERTTRFLGIILRVLRLEVYIYNVYITKPVSDHFCSREGGGGRVKSVVEVTVNS